MMAYFLPYDLPSQMIREAEHSPRLGGFARAPTYRRFRSPYLGQTRSRSTRYSLTRMRQLVAPVARAENLPAALILAVSYRESGWHPWVTSSANAMGLMQLIPSTANMMQRSVGKAPLLDGKPDFFAPAWNLKAGSRYLKQLLRSFKQDIRDSLVGYVAGPGASRRLGGYYGRWIKDSAATGGYRLIRPNARVRKYVDDVLANFTRLGGSAKWLADHTKRTGPPKKPGTNGDLVAGKKPTPPKPLGKVPKPAKKPPTTTETDGAVVAEAGGGDGGGFLLFLLALGSFLL